MNWITWPFRILFFSLWFLKEIATSNVKVLRDNLTPGQGSTPGICRLETECQTDVEVTLLAALITLTPGTLSLGTTIDDDRHVLFVHGMYFPDGASMRAELRVMELRMLAAIRRDGVKR